jgi:hypothetical protein
MGKRIRRVGELSRTTISVASEGRPERMTFDGVAEWLCHLQHDPRVKIRVRTTSTTWDEIYTEEEGRE